MTKKVNGAKKGKQFERDVANDIGHIFPEAQRNLEYQASNCVGVDLTGTDIFRIQCKNYQAYASISKIFEIRDPDPNHIPLLVTKGNKLKPMAVLPWDKFILMLEHIYLGANQFGKTTPVEHPGISHIVDMTGQIPKQLEGRNIIDMVDREKLTNTLIDSGFIEVKQPDQDTLDAMKKDERYHPTIDGHPSELVVDPQITIKKLEEELQLDVTYTDEMFEDRVRLCYRHNGKQDEFYMYHCFDICKEGAADRIIRTIKNKEDSDRVTLTEICFNDKYMPSDDTVFEVPEEIVPSAYYSFI